MCLKYLRLICFACFTENTFEFGKRGCSEAWMFGCLVISSRMATSVFRTNKQGSVLGGGEFAWPSSLCSHLEQQKK